MFWRPAEKFKLIPVLPMNYRSISLCAIETASHPVVLIDKHVVTDFSDKGDLTQKGIRDCINFEIRDGNVGILGFHDHPDEMWINEYYQEFAKYCEKQGWLRIEGAAS
jgi:hypothetical protein